MTLAPPPLRAVHPRSRPSTLPAVAVGLLLFLATGATGVEAQSRPFTAEDMLDVVRISGDVEVSPEGDRLAFVLPDLDDEWNVLARRQAGSVHVLELDIGTDARPASPTEPVRIGPPGQRSSFPSFSPDGARVALFVLDSERGEPDGARLAVWDFDQDRLRLVGEPFGDRPSTAPQWASPSRIVYVRPSPPAPPPEQPRIQVLTTDDPLPGDAYFRREVRAGLAVVDLESSIEQTVIPDGGGVTGFEVSPDGAHVIVDEQGRRGSVLWALPREETAQEPMEEAAREGSARRIGEITGQGSWMADGRLLLEDEDTLVALDPRRPAAPPEPVAPLSGMTAGVTESPFGSHLAGLAPDPSLTDTEIEPPRPGMYTIARPFMDLVLVDVADGRSTNVTGDITDDVRSAVWSRDGTALYFVSVDNETYAETLWRYHVASGRRSALATGREAFENLVAVPGGVLASVQSATTPPDLWRFGAEGGDSGASGGAAGERSGANRAGAHVQGRTKLTELNPQLAAFDFSEPRLFHFENADGVRLGALLYRATGPEAGFDEPVITYVYEKLTPRIHRFQDRHQIFATHGYAVLMPNVMIEVGAPGDSYVKAVVPAVEATHAMGFTNDRACMWGGSFGAYATSFVITQTNIFDCAVSRATPPELFRNWASGRDRDSNNIERGQARIGGSPFEVQDRYISQSAFFHLDQVETPVLITHGIKDYTILFEEGAMMFYALRRLGKEATLVAYREGDHSLYRHSRSDALDVHRRMLEWFERYLKPEG